MSVQNRRAAVWGFFMIVLGVAGLMETFLSLSLLAWAGILGVLGLGVFAYFLTDRSARGFLIAVYVVWVIAGMLALMEFNILQDEIIATYVLGVIAFPFLIVYLLDRAKSWAMITAYVLLAVAGLVGLIGVGILRDMIIPAYVMFAIAIPFLAVFARNPTRWWALIPGGIMSIIGASFLLAEAVAQYILPAFVILAGIWIMVRQFSRKEPSAVEATEPAGPEPE